MPKQGYWPHLVTAKSRLGKPLYRFVPMRFYEVAELVRLRTPRGIKRIVQRLNAIRSTVGSASD